MVTIMTKSRRLHLLYWCLLFLTIHCNVIQEGVPYQGTIKPYETQKIQYSGDQGLKRVYYFQCTGSADLSIMEINDDSSTKELSYFKDFVTKTSEDCQESYYCYASPCDISTCPNAPADAECRDNYCDGCIAEYWSEGELVECNAPGSSGNIIYTKGAPPHNAVLQFKDADYTFNLLGKRSSIDSTNTFQLYVFDNFEVDSLIMIGDEAEVSVGVENSVVKLEWKPPVYAKSEDALKHYCIYHLEVPYGQQLHGDWVACGHEIKKTETKPDCTTGNNIDIKGLDKNKTHYIWVVAVSHEGNTTAYPFVRVDMEEDPLNKTLLLTYSIFLLILSIFLN